MTRLLLIVLLAGCVAPGAVPERSASFPPLVPVIEYLPGEGGLLGSTTLTNDGGIALQFEGMDSDLDSVELVATGAALPVLQPGESITIELHALPSLGAAPTDVILIATLTGVLPAAPDPLVIAMQEVRLEPLCDQDGDGDASIACDGGDCDDLDPVSFLGAPEQCNDRDDDCDGTIDNGFVLVPEDYGTLQAAFDGDGRTQPMCLGPGVWEQDAPWIHEGADFGLFGARGPQETVVEFDYGSGEVPQLIRAGGVVQLGGLTFEGNHPVLVAVDADVTLSDVFFDEVQASQPTSAAVLSVDGGDLALSDVRLQGSGVGRGWDYAIHVHDGALVATGLELIDWEVGRAVLGVTEGGLVLVEDVYTEGTTHFGDLSAVMAFEAETVTVRRLDSYGNGVPELELDTSERAFVSQARRYQSDHGLIRNLAGNTHAEHLDVRSDRPGMSPLVDAVGGDVIIQQAILAGSFGAVVRWEDGWTGGTLIEHGTFVGVPGGEDALTRQATPGGSLGLVSCTVSVDLGPTSFAEESGPSSSNWGWSYNTNFDFPPDVEFGSLGAHTDSLAVEPRLMDWSGEESVGWDLRLQATSPLVDAGNDGQPDPNGERADIGAYGGQGAAEWDLDGDGSPQPWRPGGWMPGDAGLGLDCDDADPTVFGTQGCD